MNRKSRLILLILFYFQAFIVSAQESDLKHETTSDSLGNKYLKKAIKAYDYSYDSAFIYLEKSFFHFDNEENQAGKVLCYVGFSSLHKYQGNYLKRDSFSKMALKLAEANLDKKSLEYAAAINSEASRLKEKGDYHQAIQLLKEALVINKFLKIKIYIANTLANLGDTYFKLGDYDEALSYFKESHQYHLDTMGRSWRSATVGIKIGDALSALNKKAEADTSYIESERILSEERKKKRKKEKETENILKRLSLVLFQQAAMALDQEDWEKALEKVKQAQQIKIDRKIYVKDQGRAEDILGEINLAQNNFVKALSHFFKSRDLVHQEFDAFEKHPLVAKKILNIANVYQVSGEWESALQYYHEALEMVTHEPKESTREEKIDIKNIYAKSTALKAFRGKAESNFQGYKTTGNQRYIYTAFNNYQQAFQLVALIRQTYLGKKSKEQLSTNVLSLFEGAIHVALALYELSGDFKYLEEAYSYAESNKAIGLLESMNELNAMRFAGIPDSLAKKEKKISLDIAYYEKIFNEENQKLNTKDLFALSTCERKIINLRQEYNSLIEIFEKDFPKYYQLKYNTDLASLTEVQGKLKDDGALIEYFVGFEAVFVFTITAKNVEVDSFPLTDGFIEYIKNIDALISHSPSSKDVDSTYQEFIIAAHGLYQKLIPPNIDQSINELVLIPDDLLCQLPFEVLLKELPDGNAPQYTLDNLSYLLEDFDISYSYSATLLLRGFDDKKAKATTVFTGFAPSFEEPAIANSVRACDMDKMHSLLCNQDEVSRIHDLLGGKVFFGEKADMASFKLHAPKSNIIHLATHACIDKNNHQFNKIFLADDYLSNNDLYNLFFQTELAVLSACNTGTGQLVKGEGVMSLSRAFTHAGCPSTVMSLWSVNDCTTSDIMVRFYQHLNNGLDKNQALKLAKIDFLKHSNKVQNHPFYWAAFVQFGNTNKLIFKKAPIFPSKLLLFSSLGFGLLLMGYFIQRHS